MRRCDIEASALVRLGSLFWVWRRKGAADAADLMAHGMTTHRISSYDPTLFGRLGSADRLFDSWGLKI